MGHRIKKNVVMSSLLLASMALCGLVSTEANADTSFNEVLHTGSLLPSVGPGRFIIAHPVPEADTWAMIGVGVALIGFQLRRRKNKNSTDSENK